MPQDPNKFANPFLSFRNPTEHELWELLKDGISRRDTSLRASLAAKNLKNKLTRPLREINNRGLRPNPPDYPTGQWVVIRERGFSRLKFNDAVEQFDTEKVEKFVDEKVQDMIQKYAETQLAAASKEHMELIAKQIEELKKSSVPILELTRYEDGKKTIKKVEPAHEMMQYLLYLLAQGEHVYLWGDAGSGKSTAAFMAAQALGRRYGYISLTPQTFESRLFGFISPTGKYITTEFRECYEKGGVYCIDEGDNGSGNLYTALNGALENNICSFPDKQVKRHKDFVVVMTGNTSGGGPNPMFPTRRPFDKAFAERFTYIEWGYDERLERAIALSINAEVAPIWHEYCLKLRAYCRQHQPMVLVSPRAVFKGCKYMRDAIMPLDLLMQSVIFKGYDATSVKAILAANPVPKDALNAAVLAWKEKNKTSAKKGSRANG